VSRLDLSIGRFQIDNQTRLGAPVAIVCLHEGYESAFLHAQLGGGGEGGGGGKFIQEEEEKATTEEEEEGVGGICTYDMHMVCSRFFPI
jgi:hypothetical protein